MVKENLQNGRIGNWINATKTKQDFIELQWDL